MYIKIRRRKPTQKNNVTFLTHGVQYIREQENIHKKWLKSRVTFGIIVGRVREGKDAAINPADLTTGTSAFPSNDNPLFVFLFLSAK